MRPENPNLEHRRIGRKCEKCGSSYMVVVVVGPDLGDAKRGCGCPASVVDVEAESEQDRAQDTAADLVDGEHDHEQAATDGGSSE